MHTALVALIALAGGVAAGLQAQLVSFLGQRIGTMGSVFVTHLGGAVIAFALLFATPTGSLSSWRGVPWYLLVATGALGVALLSAFSYTIPRLGVAATLTLVVMAQLTIGALADHRLPITVTYLTTSHVPTINTPIPAIRVG